jgi:hypothetical protein
MQRTTFQLHAAPVIALEAGGELPARIKLLNWGENATTKGPFIVGPGTLAALNANQKRYGFDKVALDFNHNTVPGTPAYAEAQEPRPVAGYGVPEVVEGEGLFLRDIEWTPAGREHAANFRDVSGTLARDAGNEVVFMHSAAICRQGAAPGMELVAASVELGEAGGTPAPTGETGRMPAPTGEAGRMPAPTVTPLDAEAMAAVVDAVGSQLRDAEWRKRELADLAAALEAERTRNATLQTALDALSAQVAELKSALEAARAAAAPVEALTTLTAEVAALRTSGKREVLLLGARLQGKVVALSAEAVAKLSDAELADHIARLPVTVPLGRLTALSAREPGGAPAEPPPHAAAVARMCGVDPAQAAKQPLPGINR